MRLALAMGRVDVDKMLEEITERQFVEWYALYRIEPWGDEREDLRYARQTSSICNAWGARTTPQEFLFDFENMPTASAASKSPDALGLARQLARAGFPVVVKNREADK